MPQDGALSEQGSTVPAVEVHLAKGKMRMGGADCPHTLCWRHKGLSNWRGYPCSDESTDEGVCGVTVGRAVQRLPDLP